jgi:hypothetical protein
MLQGEVGVRGAEAGVGVNVPKGGEARGVLNSFDGSGKL